MWSGDFLQIFVVNIQITDWSLLSKNWQDHSYNNHHLFHRKLSKNRYQLLTTKTWTKRQFEVFRVIRHQNAPTCWLKCLNMTQHFYKNCNHISWQEAWNFEMWNHVNVILIIVAVYLVTFMPSIEIDCIAPE